MNNEELFKEIDLIQNCINRMSQNSFQIKIFAFTIITGISGFSQSENFRSLFPFLCTIIFPLILFWGLDAFYLNCEKRYRKLYTEVLEKRKNSDLAGQYELDPKTVTGMRYVSTLFSKTLIGFYLLPLLVSILAYCILNFVM